jgi:uncharacterized protein YukE
MANPVAETESLLDVLTDARETAREQLAAAWQIEIDRVQEQLNNAWRGHLERVFEERFAELSVRLAKQTEARIAEARARSLRDLTGKLNQAVRRLRAFENEEEWSRAVVDATEGFSERAALFVVNGAALRLLASRGISSDAKIDNTPLDSAPAFAGVVESRDPIVALRTPGELSEAIAGVFDGANGETPEQRFYLFPIVSRDRVAAVLYADTEVEPSAIELVASFASAVLDAQSASPDRSKLVSIATGGQRPTSISQWASLGKDERELHLRAQRFARVQVAEMRLYHSQAVKDGRSRHDLYEALQEQIDRTRDAFRSDFLSASQSMVDYVHVELLRTLANDDVELLGSEYPGPLV